MTTSVVTSAHFFGEGNEDYRGRPCYLSAFLRGALEIRDVLEPEVEPAQLPSDCLSALDQGAIAEFRPVRLCAGLRRACTDSAERR